MAHANYNCCAICDSKLEYAGANAVSKKRICEDCLLKLQKMGLNIVSVEQLVNWIKNEDKNILYKKLKELNFRVCFYYNDVDKALIEREIEFDENGEII